MYHFFLFCTFCIMSYSCKCFWNICLERIKFLCELLSAHIMYSIIYLRYLKFYRFILRRFLSNSCIILANFCFCCNNVWKIHVKSYFIIIRSVNGYHLEKLGMYTITKSPVSTAFPRPPLILPASALLWCVVLCMY